MTITLRRVLVLLVLLLAALPWLTEPAKVLAQDADKPATQADTPAETPADPSAQTPANANTPQPLRGLSVPTGGKIAIIEISGPIMYDHHVDSVKRRIDRAVKDGADLIVFDLDTPGGRLDLALDMSSTIRTLKVPTVAWVDNQALSAGILIASACDELVMSRASLAGDCAPILPGQSLAPTERAKALSPLLAEFRANAQDNYSGPTISDYALFHAMCVLGIEVYQVRHKLTGETRLVSQADYEIMVNGMSPIDASKLGTAANSSALTNPATYDDVARPVVSVTDMSQVGQWELVQQVHDGSTLLTMNEVESLKTGLSRATVSSEAELQKLYGAGSTIRYDETWSESLVGFLVHPIVRACLLMLGIAGVMMEYFSPGLFVPGIIGLAAFATLIGAPFLVGLAQTWHLVLIVIGAALVIYELFTMTTFGVLAVLGLLMFLAGLVLSGVQSATNGLPASGGEVVVTSLAFVGSIVLLVPLLIVFTRYFGSLPLFNKLVLTESQPASITAAGAPPMPYQRISGDEWVGGGKVRPGMVGTVTSTGLRPAGRIAIDDLLIDVTSTGGFIEAGTSVRVIAVHGNMISVEPVE